jgi:hypothetical protein
MVGLAVKDMDVIYNPTLEDLNMKMVCNKEMLNRIIGGICMPTLVGTINHLNTVAFIL